MKFLSEICGVPCIRLCLRCLLWHRRDFFGMRPSKLSQDPEVIRDSLIDAINTGGTKIKNPNEPAAEVAVAKLESYTILGAFGLNAHSHLIEGSGRDARFRPEVTARAWKDSINIQSRMKPMFLRGYDQLVTSTQWAEETSYRFRGALRDYFDTTGRQGETLLSNPLREVIGDGGAVAFTIGRLVNLAAKQQAKEGTVMYRGMARDEAVEIIEQRHELVKDLAYLGLSHASVNMGFIDNSENPALPLDMLEGDLTTVAMPDGSKQTKLRRSSRQNMRAVFPASLPDWTEHPMQGPTLKCPMHQIPAAGKGKKASPDAPTPLTDYLHASIDFAWQELRPHVYATGDEREIMAGIN